MTGCLKTWRSDIAEETRNLPDQEAYQDHVQGKDDIIIETWTKKDLAHAAVKRDQGVVTRRDGPGLDQTPKANTNIVAGVVARAGRRRRGQRKYGEKVAVVQLAL